MLKINNFLIFGYIYYIYVRSVFDDWLRTLCFMELTLLLWFGGLSTVNHLTAFCELLICLYRRVR